MKTTIAEQTELSAIAFGNNKELLKKELLTVKKCLSDKNKQLFGKGTFEFENKRLLSDSGEMALQWKLRNYPDEKICYENQQTSQGIISLVDLKTYYR